MFTRTHRMGRNVYTEALESYRCPDTGKPKHRLIARWSAARTLAEELALTQHAIERATFWVAHYRAWVDGTRQIGHWRHHRIKARAPEDLRKAQADLDKAQAHHAKLTAAREAGVVADPADIERAYSAEAKRRGSFRARLRSSLQLEPEEPEIDRAALIDRLRDLATKNDPEAMRDGLAELIETLEGQAQPAG
jgi:hypothetical protein